MNSKPLEEYYNNHGSGPPTLLQLRELSLQSNAIHQEALEWLQHRANESPAPTNFRETEAEGK